jgi:hypothetical protein
MDVWHSVTIPDHRNWGGESGQGDASFDLRQFAALNGVDPERNGGDQRSRYQERQGG